ncbi:MAG: DUF502 domain-containing protein [Candidatus Electryonea clarkiae]|nr:DUF502 domain-containing protein [Candidatus Electryonea clarkiae]MDP8289266.1 DUF502 domain-containing protein [Candidatus Electryonea clarkiae]
MTNGHPSQDSSSSGDRFKRLRNWFVTGIVFIGPLFLTIWIVSEVFVFSDNVLGRPIRWILANLFDISFFQDNMIRGIGFLTLIALIVASGWFASQVLGVRIAHFIRRSIERIPLVNKVYTAIFQISQAMIGGKKEVFKQAVLLEYPHKGMWCIGFLTQDTRGPVQEILDEDVISVFLPTTPNPTSGFLLFVPKKDVRLLDIPVEEALKLIISAGALQPESSGNSSEMADIYGIKYYAPIKRGGSGE